MQKSNNTVEPVNPVMTNKDLETDQDIRWCPGCGDYSILKQVQKIIPEIGIKREDIVFVSGIGCSSRFPYYMNTYGMHSIHGRATSIATGLKVSRPELSVWVVTGDGDLLSIGTNHFVHMLRRNPDINVLLFNNEIYGLTKGQYSPTSQVGQITKSSPFGSIDHPFNPLALAYGANGTFLARTLDRDPKHLQQTLREAVAHKGTSLIEIYQNCNIFNDGAFFPFTEKSTKAVNTVMLENGKPLVFGENNHMGIRLNGLRPQVVDIEKDGYSYEDLWIHDSTDSDKAALLVRFFDDVKEPGHLPRPFGVLHQQNRPCFETLVNDQIEDAMQSKGNGDLDKILKGNSVWSK